MNKIIGIYLMGNRDVGIGLPLYLREEFKLQQKLSKTPYEFKDYDKWFEHVNKTKKKPETLGWSEPLFLLKKNSFVVLLKSTLVRS